MRGFLLVLLAACGADGILVEVRPPAGAAASTVELFLGVRPCTLEGVEKCTRMQPPDFDRPEAADVYFRQAAVLTAPVTDGAARFVLGAEDKTIVVAIAVAFGGEAPVGVGHIEDLDLRRDPFHVILDLSPPTRLAQVPSDDRARLAVWGSGSVRCAGVPLADGTIAFVVPDSDPDCDAVATECDPLAYRVSRPSNRICADTLPAVSGPACMIGGVPCREDPSAPAPACLTGFEPLCVPSEVCACAAGDAACIRDQFLAPTTPRVTCSFASVVNPANTAERIPCSGAVPGSMPAKLDLRPLGFPFRCAEAPELGPVALPLELRGDLQLAGQKVTQTEFVAAPCAVSLKWEGAVATQTPQAQDALISLHVEAGVTVKRRQVLLPLSVSFDATCDTQPTCALANGADLDTVWNCAH